jgi:hypothetical protein
LGGAWAFDIDHNLRGCGRCGVNENPGKGEHRGAHVFFLQYYAGNLQA